MTITEIERAQMCPLPKGYWWNVEVIPRLDSLHLNLMQGHWWNHLTTLTAEVDGASVVLDLSEADMDEAVTEVIRKSYELAQKHFNRPNPEIYQAMAATLADRLQAAGDTPVKVTVSKI